MKKIEQIIAEELNIKVQQVENTIKLIDEGNTIPFIARYRKEVTGGLSDEVLRTFGERLNYLRNLEKRKEEVTNSIEEQGKLTEEIVKDLENAITLAEVEDIYRPYKQKKKTRATVAKAKGLEPLAEIILAQEETKNIQEIAAEYISEEKEVKTVEEAIQGALDIIAEMISDNPEYRKLIKQIVYSKGIIKTTATKPEEKSAYEMYYDYSENVNKIPSHRILAINRGEKEEFLKVKIEKEEDKILEKIEKDIIKGETQFTQYLKDTIQDNCNGLFCKDNMYNVGDEIKLADYKWHVIKNNESSITLLLDGNEISNRSHIENGVAPYQWSTSNINKYLNGNFYESLLDKGVDEDEILTEDKTICDDKTGSGGNPGALNTEGLDCKSEYVTSKIRLLTQNEFEEVKSYFTEKGLDSTFLYSETVGKWALINGDSSSNKILQVDSTGGISKDSSTVLLNVRPVITLRKK